MSNPLLRCSVKSLSLRVCNLPLSFNVLLSKLTTCSAVQKSRRKKDFLENTLKSLNLIKQEVDGKYEKHLHLIEGCAQGFCKTSTKQVKNVSLNLLDKILNSVAAPCMIDEVSLHKLPNEDAILLFFRMYNEGMKIDAATVSSVLSSCAVEKAIFEGNQIHALTIKTGFSENIYIGSSLINLYSRNGYFRHAHNLFEEMPVRNIVSWTAIINGYARDLQIETCLELFHSMRVSRLDPNDYTFVSILSACTGTCSIEIGRSMHCLIVRTSFDWFTHVGNALISMYSKCGNIRDAINLFKSMPIKDMISWNSMITGYSHHGLAEQAIWLFKSMEKKKIVPDSDTFLAILSSCRHAGLVEEGKQFLNTMIERGIIPGLDHYSCVVDLLSRTGLLEEALEFIKNMPINPNAIIWGSLLSSCRNYGNFWIGIQAAKNRLLLEPHCATTHVQLANLYAGLGQWNQVAIVRKQMKEKGLKTYPGYSWIEIDHEVFRFTAEDKSNARVQEVLSLLDCLLANMKTFELVPCGHFDLYNEEEFCR